MNQNEAPVLDALLSIANEAGMVLPVPAAPTLKTIRVVCEEPRRSQ